MFNSVVAITLFVALASAGNLPPWIKSCKMGPKFNECSLKNGRLAMPFVMKGDTKYRIPAMDPLTISELKITENGGKSIAMNITMRNAKIHGLRNANFASSKFDFQKRHIEWVFTDIDLLLLSNYKISGKFLVVPIVGEGRANITLKKVKLLVTIDYKVEKKKGVDYMVITNLDVKYATSKLSVHLENLFNGDKMLGKNMNAFLNENWQDLNDSVGPSIAKGIALYVKQILDNIAKSVPMNEIFDLPN